MIHRREFSVIAGGLPHDEGDSNQVVRDEAMANDDGIHDENVTRRI